MLDGDLTLRLLLLSETGSPPLMREDVGETQRRRLASGIKELEKSEVNLYSHSGSVNVELVRVNFSYHILKKIT